MTWMRRMNLYISLFIILKFYKSSNPGNGNVWLKKNLQNDPWEQLKDLKIAEVSMHSGYTRHFRPIHIMYTC